MRILVLIKQVPAGSASLNEEGLLDRTKTGTTINPYDLVALETGIKIKKELIDKGEENIELNALTMGPVKAKDVLTTSFSYGYDNGYLLSDPAFAGADVFSTAFCIKEAIKLLGPFDIVITGQQTTDGDTAQVPFSIGAQLDIPVVGWIKKIVEVNHNCLTVEQELSLYNQEVEVEFPILISVGQSVCSPHIPSLRDQLTAKRKQAKTITLKDLCNKNKLDYGLNASPTRVISVNQIEHSKKTQPIFDFKVDDFKKLVCDLKHKIEQEGL